MWNKLVFFLWGFESDLENCFMDISIHFSCSPFNVLHSISSVVSLSSLSPSPLFSVKFSMTLCAAAFSGKMALLAANCWIWLLNEQNAMSVTKQLIWSLFFLFAILFVYWILEGKLNVNVFFPLSFLFDISIPLGIFEWK